jgi:hypothetical protein
MPKSHTNVGKMLNFMVNDADIKVELKVIILQEAIK